MAWPVYSERLLIHQGLGVSAAYVVPAGYRAVVKSVAAHNTEAVAAVVSIQITGIYVWAVTVQAQNGTVSPAFMLVLYAGDALVINHSQTNVRSVACGYVFKDPIGGLALQEAQKLPEKNVAQLGAA